MLTGEADNVRKRPGDALLSGSFLSAGQCRARLTAVGRNCWAARLSQEAKRDKKQRSAIMSALDGWLKLVGFFIVPLGAAMLVRQLTLDGATFGYAVTSTVAALVGMIPEGLYLLTSIALALGVLRLAKRRTLAHELSCIEALARIDTLCIDKTGTITTGNMRLEQVCPADGCQPAAAREALAACRGADLSKRHGLCPARRFARGRRAGTLRARYPFPPSGNTPPLCWKTASAGPWAPRKKFWVPRAGTKPWPTFCARACAFYAWRASAAPEGTAPCWAPSSPCAGPCCATSFGPTRRPRSLYFERQGVTVKVISGDNAQSAARVAQSAGIAGAQNFLDCAPLPEDADFGPYCEETAVFGRVSPRHKQAIIRALQAKGHRVAMVGDGVNDVLALKQADCSVAMAGGSDAAGQTAQLVLLDAQFFRHAAHCARGQARHCQYFALGLAVPCEEHLLVPALGHSACVGHALPAAAGTDQPHQRRAHRAAVVPAYVRALGRAREGPFPSQCAAERAARRALRHAVPFGHVCPGRGAGPAAGADFVCVHAAGRCDGAVRGVFFCAGRLHGCAPLSWR